jgi:2,3-dihydroxy-p-cumate/2,3-dihydroxybenzoate 3,4-dioxygenase
MARSNWGFSRRAYSKSATELRTKAGSVSVVVLEQLRYVRLVANELGRAADFAQRVLGLEPIERTPELATFRSDFRDHTLAFATGEHAVQSVGLEVRSSKELDAAAEGLGRVGVVVDRGSADDCALRKVKDMLWFTDCSGNRIELVVRPLNSGWRYFPSRDVGITGLSDVMIRSVDIDKDLSIWCDVLGAQISDWAGDAAYLRFDDAHHRIVLFPGVQGGILTVEYAVENVDLLMRNYYALRELQVGILHGPGRRPASEQLFLTFAGPTEVLFGFVAEGAAATEKRLPRQFPAGAAGLCSWGSECKIGEFGASSEHRSNRSTRRPLT